MPNVIWFYANRDGVQQGPVDAAFMQAAFRDGRLRPDSLVWRDGLSQWVPLHSVAAEMGLGTTPAQITPPQNRGAQRRKAAIILIVGLAIAVYTYLDHDKQADIVAKAQRQMYQDEHASQ